MGTIAAINKNVAIPGIPYDDLVIRCYSLRTAGATHDSLAYDVMDLSKALEAGRASGRLMDCWR
jgi:hypothetical protein